MTRSGRLRVRAWLLAGFSLLAASLARPVPAAEGVVEINQARALAGGVTPGDLPGFPVTLSGGASYVLTSNLTLTDPNVGAIVVSGDGASLDLNGFEIAGPMSCSGLGPALFCTPIGSGIGIDARSSTGFALRNGGVRGFGGGGVWLGFLANAEDVSIASNGFGLNIGFRSRASRVRAYKNVGPGIQTGDTSVVESCVAVGNGGNGISTGFRSDVGGSTAYSNAFDGISASSGSVVRNSTATGNARNGVSISGSGNLVTRNAVFSNMQIGIVAGRAAHVVDNATSYNIGAGVSVNGDSSVQRNVVDWNGNFGLSLCETVGNKPAFRENVMNGNAGGPVSLAGGVVCGLSELNNTCNGAVCP